MKSWKVLERAITADMVEDVAERMHVSADTVRRWRRAPESDDEPLATGRKNPLDRQVSLVEIVFLTNPLGAHSVARHPLDRYEELAETLVLREPVKNLAARALRDVVCAVEAINLDESAEEVERRWEEAFEKMHEVKRRVRVSYAGKNGDGYVPTRGELERALKNTGT